MLISKSALWAGILGTAGLLLWAGPFNDPQVSGEGWFKALAPRIWTFPADHGSHPDFRTEWWYFTGNLEDDQGRAFGYQLTFFRQGVRFSSFRPENPWLLRDVYFAHFAVTDISAKEFFSAEKISRAGPGLAEAASGDLDLRLLNWSASLTEDVIRLTAETEGRMIDLELEASSPPVLHGEGGLSHKGPGSAQASYYVSLTRLETRGTLKTSAGDAERDVRGTSWFDHEFGSDVLSGDQAGWDWFGLQLSDGRDLMIFRLRQADGSKPVWSSGTLVESDGTTRHLKFSDFQLEERQNWTSPASGAAYPVGWRILIPGAGLDLLLSPRIEGQELSTNASTGILYWEGAVHGRGSSLDQPVSFLGYMELTGYAGRMGGLF